MSNKFGFDEVIDTTADSIEVADAFEKRLEDGFQTPDTFVIMEKYGTLMEIKNDFPIFLQQVKDLDAQEYDQVVTGVAERTGKNEGWVRNNLVRVLKVVNRVLKLYFFAKEEVLDIYDDIKLLGSDVPT